MNKLNSTQHIIILLVLLAHSLVTVGSVSSPKDLQDHAQIRQALIDLKQQLRDIRSTQDTLSKERAQTSQDMQTIQGALNMLGHLKLFQGRLAKFQEDPYDSFKEDPEDADMPYGSLERAFNDYLVKRSHDHFYGKTEKDCKTVNMATLTTYLIALNFTPTAIDSFLGCIAAQINEKENHLKATVKRLQENIQKIQKEFSASDSDLPTVLTTKEVRLTELSAADEKVGKEKTQLLQKERDLTTELRKIDARLQPTKVDSGQPLPDKLGSHEEHCW